MKADVVASGSTSSTSHHIPGYSETNKQKDYIKGYPYIYFE